MLNSPLAEAKNLKREKEEGQKKKLLLAAPMAAPAKAKRGTNKKKKMLSAPLATLAEKKYWCYYPNHWRDSVSPVCRIFLYFFSLLFSLHSFKKGYKMLKSAKIYLKKEAF